jgi:hypothetical protein
MDSKNSSWTDGLKSEYKVDMPWWCGDEECDYCLPNGKYTVTKYREVEAYIQTQDDKYAKQVTAATGSPTP